MLRELALDTQKPTVTRIIFMDALSEVLVSDSNLHVGMKKANEAFHPFVKDPDKAVRAFGIHKIINLRSNVSLEGCREELLSLKSELIQAFYDYFEYDISHKGQYASPFLESFAAIIGKPRHYLIHSLVKEIKDEVRDEVYKGLEHPDERVRRLAEDIIKHVYEVKLDD